MEEDKVNLYISRVEEALKKANAYDYKLNVRDLQLPGMSGIKTRIFFNGLVFKDTRYLEIGVWQGSTFISALVNNDWELAVAIDNFSEFEGAEEIFIGNCQHHVLDFSPEEAEGKKFYFLNIDCFKLTNDHKTVLRDMNLYFYDGGHSYNDQFDAIAMFKDIVAEKFILIVDDWNWDPVKQGTRDAIKKMGYKTHKEWELLNPNPEKQDDFLNWWNGLYVAVLEKQ